MHRFIVFLLSSFLLISCSTKTDKIIPQNSIIGKDITSTEANTQETTLNIALVVPLNSKQDNNGASLVQSAQMAIDEANNNDVHLTILDSNLISSSPNSLLSDLEKQQVIIGPLYGPDTQKLADLMTGKNIPILSLSNDSSLKSDSLLIVGISPSSQTTTIINYAISQGISTFHLLLPENKFGHLVNDAVETILSGKNGMTYTVNWYDNSNSENVINQLVQTLDHNSGAQAVFMPQGDKKALHQLNKDLSNHKSKVKLLGLQGWDNHEILSLNHLNGAIFLRKNLNHGSFNTKFNHLFGSSANNLDFIVYNSLLMTINMHNNKLALNKQSIIEHNQEGKYSEVSFNQQGLSIYNLPIAQINNKEFVDISKNNED